MTTSLSFPSADLNWDHSWDKLLGIAPSPSADANIFRLKLLKLARGSGNDQYEGEGLSKLYLPKSVTHGKTELTLTLHSEPAESRFLFTMKKEAKGSGGDRYETSDPQWGGQDMYLPRAYRTSKCYISVSF